MTLPVAPGVNLQLGYSLGGCISQFTIVNVGRDQSWLLCFQCASPNARRAVVSFSFGGEWAPSYLIRLGVQEMM